MLLTGPEIARLVAAGTLKIDPFDESRLGPNSYDVALGPTLKIYDAQFALLRRLQNDMAAGEPMVLQYLDPYDKNATVTLSIPQEGLILYPGILYLGSTVEYIDSPYPYVPDVDGRSTWGRLGTEIHRTAGRGDCGFRGNFTLEISCIVPIKVRRGDLVGQVYFTRTEGERLDYKGRYLDQKGTTAAAPLPKKNDPSVEAG